MSENERIKEVRSAIGLTQDRFGAKLGVGKTAVSKVENGERGVTDQLRLAVCREFRVSEDWLRTGEGDMFVEVDEDDEITRFMGDILSGQPDFRRRLVSVLARLSPDEWALLEAKIKELSGE